MTPTSFRTMLARRAATLFLACGLVALAAKVVSGREVRAAFVNPVAPAEIRAELVNLPGGHRRDAPRRALSFSFDSLFGRSRQLRARLLSHDEVSSYPALLERFGEGVRQPGIRAIDSTADGARFAFITLTPWQRKLGSQINGYNVGWWPAEQRTMPSHYENPVGFIEVTRENVDTRISTHFTLREFMTHDQANVWPKYVVLREELLDKLELVLTALQSFGVGTQNVVVLSGFRSPQYNTRGAGEGMARASRHQFGDAADIIIDGNRDGRMDDLNADGRVDFQDTQVIAQAVSLVEHKFPELVGGLGLYHETGPSGPFAHLDVRGTRARWTNTGRSRGTRYASSPWTGTSGSTVRSSGKCRAEGAMAVLCAGIR
jgi:hypothetical protein